MRKAKTACFVLLLVLSGRFDVSSSDVIMDMLSPFIDFEGMVPQAAEELPEGGVAAAPVDDTYPLASAEMYALLQMYRGCRTRQSTAMSTWCTGSDEDSSLDVAYGESRLCPRGVLTHPCTGRVLRTNASDEFLWQWEGIRCDPFTDPTTVTHIYLPDDSLMCELAELDLSVMVSLEQLDLSGNELYGVFPEWLGEMTMLRLLNLANNELAGDIPASLADNDALELINLSDNQLTASTLSFFDAFRRLQHLDLSLNKIALQPPKSLFASEFLQTMNLSHNDFHGELPEMPLFKYLVSLDLSFNSLTGKLPPQISQWGQEDPRDPDSDLPAIVNQPSLQRFDIQGNSFSGLLSELPQQLLGRVQRRLCPVGSYSGASKCEKCPRGTFSADEGLSQCKSCPLGSDAAPGASACVECSWFTYACEGFWEDVVVSGCVGAALLRLIFLKLRRLCIGDQTRQQLDESVALMTAVRAHGRTFDGVRYAPMGLVSADTMFGKVCSSSNAGAPCMKQPK